MSAYKVECTTFYIRKLAATTGKQRATTTNGNAEERSSGLPRTRVSREEIADAVIGGEGPGDLTIGAQLGCLYVKIDAYKQVQCPDEMLNFELGMKRLFTNWFWFIYQ